MTNILVQVFVAFGCDVGYDVIIATITATINSMFVYPLVYNQELDLTLVAHKLSNIVATLIMSSVVMLFLTYVVHIKAQVEELIEENLGLLNNMHEGLVLVDKENPKFNICTSPAFSIFKAFTPGGHKQPEAQI